MNYTYTNSIEINDAHDPIGYTTSTLTTSTNTADTEPVHVFTMTEMMKLPYKVVNAVVTDELSLRIDQNIFADVGLQKALSDLIFSYDLPWLWLGFEAILLAPDTWLATEYLQNVAKEVYTCITHPAKQKHVIKTLLFEQIINNEEIIAKYAKYRPLKEHQEVEMRTELRRHLLKKVLHLLYFLDKARQMKAIKLPKLFNTESTVKSSKEVLIAFCSLCMHGESNVISHLASLGYDVGFEQMFTDEYHFQVTDITADLKDGIKLAKLVEIISQQELCSYLRVPAVSRLQKIFNVTLSLRTLHQTHSGFYHEHLSSVYQQTLASGGTLSNQAVKSAAVESAKAVEDRINRDAKEIVDGRNKDFVVMLIERIMAAFHSKEVVSVGSLQHESRRLSGSSPLAITEGQNYDPSFDDTHIALLNWCNAVLMYYHKPIADLTESLADGTALCYIVHHYHPRLLPLKDFQGIKEALGSKNKSNKFEHIQKVYSLLRRACKSLGSIPLHLFELPHDLKSPPCFEAHSAAFFLSNLFNRLMKHLRIQSATQIQHAFKLKYSYLPVFKKRAKPTVRKHIPAVFQSPVISIAVSKVTRFGMVNEELTHRFGMLASDDHAMSPILCDHKPNSFEASSDIPVEALDDLPSEVTSEAPQAFVSQDQSPVPRNNVLTGKRSRVLTPYDSNKIRNTITSTIRKTARDQSLAPSSLHALKEVSAKLSYTPDNWGANKENTYQSVVQCMSEYSYSNTPVTNFKRTSTFQQDLENEYKSLLESKIRETTNMVEESVRREYEGYNKATEETLQAERSARMSAESQVQLEAQRRAQLEERLRALEDEKANAEYLLREEKLYHQRLQLKTQAAKGTITRIIYGYVCQQGYKRCLIAIPKFQALCRMFLVQRQLRRLGLVVSLVQALWRKKLFNRRLVRMSKAAMVIQAAWYVHCQRKQDIAIHQCVTRIQAWYRTQGQRRAYGELVASVIRMQSLARRVLAVCKWRKTLAAAGVIHTALRRMLATRRVEKIRNAYRIIGTPLSRYAARRRLVHAQGARYQEERLHKIQLKRATATITQFIYLSAVRTRRHRAANKIIRMVRAYTPLIFARRIRKGITRLQVHIHTCYHTHLSTSNNKHVHIVFYRRYSAPIWSREKRARSPLLRGGPFVDWS